MQTAPPPADALTSLGSWMDEASEKRHLPDPRLTVGTSENNKANSAQYVRALQSRLVSLGYIDRERLQEGLLTAALGDAIRHFQKDSGFTADEIDGWAGPRTKRRLQQLVSFENDQDPSQWEGLEERPEQHAAVQRAVYLRLYSLGFMSWSQRLQPGTDYCFDSNFGLEAAFEQFLRCAGELGLAPARSAPVLDATTLRLLFHHDTWVRALAWHPSFVADPENVDHVDAVGRVELWLLGYDVAIAVHPLHGSAEVDTALDDFANKFPAAVRAAHGNRFTAAFFASVVNMDDGKEDDPAGSDEAIEHEIGRNPAGIAEHMGKLAAGAWDGIRRAWAFIKAVARKALEAVKTQLWNLARVVGARARESYEAMLKAVDVVHRGVVCLRRRALSTQGSTSMLGFGNDFDTSLYIDGRAEGDVFACRSLVREDAENTCRLTVACKILGVVTQALAQSAKAIAVGATMGWLLLLVALSRAVRALRALRPEINELSEVPFSEGDSLYRNPVV